MLHSFSIQNPKFLRWITIFVSLLFIPAFMYGVASIWSVLFAITIAYYFRRRLVGAVQLSISLGRYETIKNLLFLTLDVVLFVSIPFLLQIIVSNDVVLSNTLDNYFFEKIKPISFGKIDYTEALLSEKLFFLFLFLFQLNILVMFFVAFSEVENLLIQLFTGKNLKYQNDFDQKKHALYFIQLKFFTFLGGGMFFLCLALVVCAHIFAAYLYKNADVLNDLVLVSAIIIINLVSFLILYSFHLGNLMVSRAVEPLNSHNDR